MLLLLPLKLYRDPCSKTDAKESGRLHTYVMNGCMFLLALHASSLQGCNWFLLCVLLAPQP